MSISIKGIVVGMLFGFVASLILGAGMGYAMAHLLGPEAAMNFVATSTSGKLVFPAFILAVIISVAAGYLAARVAGRGELVNAALANAIIPTTTAIIAVTFRPDALMTSLINLAVLPLFGLFGGYMRLRQASKPA